MSRGRGESGFSNGLGPDKWYLNRLGTDLPSLMFDTDISGNERDLEALREEHAQARQEETNEKEA